MAEKRYWNTLRTSYEVGVLRIAESVCTEGIKSSVGVYYEGVHIVTHPTVSQHASAGGGKRSS